MHIFTPGPVALFESTMQIGGQPIGAFRNAQFSEVVFRSERALLELTKAPAGSRVAFLTLSGTGAMETAACNFVGHGEDAAVITAGGFGDRFVDILKRHGAQLSVHKLEYGRSFEGGTTGLPKTAKALFINHHETTTGALHSLQASLKFCQETGALHIVDGISSFLCDDLDVSRDGIDVLILSSQKGLALPPGLSMLVLSPKALARLPSKTQVPLYMDLSLYLRDGERGQTPFTPCVQIIFQLEDRLRRIQVAGIQSELQRCQSNARFFRELIQSLPLKLFAQSPAHGVTAVEVMNGQNADGISTRLLEQFQCAVAANGGQLKDRVFRVSHMGNQKPADLEFLFSCLKKTMEV